jgi:hypothetical protein
VIDKLKSIGIEKGRAFRPDASMRKLLNAAIGEARAWLRNTYETAYFPPPFFAGGQWCVPASPAVVEGMSTTFGDPNAYPVDSRGVAYSLGFFSAKHFGAGQFYLMTFKDKTGRAFDGTKSYRLTVPANAPVTQYWSATAYDRDTHALIRRMPWASRSSQTPGVRRNADGSVDVHFGPKAPAGKKSNWVPTSGKGQFEVLFRFYGPGKPLFEKTWKLPDTERVK